MPIAALAGKALKRHAAFVSQDTATLDWLLRHSTTINNKGESYRLKSKRKADVLNAPVKGEEGKSATGSPHAWDSLACERWDFLACRKRDFSPRR